MPFHFTDKLVITVSSRALFNLESENAIFKRQGLMAYRAYQRKHEKIKLGMGSAFTLVKKLLRLNDLFQKDVVEVVLVSRNDADSAVRIFNSIKQYSLRITRGAFTNGQPRGKYLAAFNSKLYLSANFQDVKEIIIEGGCAAHVIGPKGNGSNGSSDGELRIAFDFDGVLVNDEPESVFKKWGKDTFYKHETENRKRPHKPGPAFAFIKAISQLKKDSEIIAARKKNRRPFIRTGIFTARNSPAHERLITTLRGYGLYIDETFFLGGATKAPFVEAFRADIFFDDQAEHLRHVPNISTAHVPYGIANL